MRKIIIKVISFILINSGLIFLIEKRILRYRSLKYENKSIFPFLKRYYHSIDYFLVTIVYFKNYYSKIKDPKKQREISFSTLNNGEGVKWARHYYENRKGNVHRIERENIYEKTSELIINNSLNNKKTLFINIGSSSGLDLVYFYKKFDEMVYLSSDINNEIINFQKEIYDNYNFNYFKGPADLVAKNLDTLAKKYNSEKIIIFCNGSLQYEIPFFLNQGLENLKNSKVRFFYCIAETYELRFTNTDSYHRKNILWTHNYPKYILKNDLTILWQKISKEDQVQNNSINIIFSNN
tara:strand:+ start:30127 stop:31008 length:882 start_codon:yes stop_codon:yes gene_type:complete